MGDDVGNDAGHDIGLAVNDDDALPPDEIEKVGVGHLIGKVVWRREQRDVLRNGPANADIDAARWNGRDGCAMLKYAPIIDTSPPRLVVTTVESSGSVSAGCEIDGAVVGLAVGGGGACGKFACSFASC